ncbi:C6 zinc finger domain-containing protein [Eremomyces bilateralis CBS 781.70]|uniref:C6 zinc finger domain-containing protein n=1 Tax=Eremomyces bilateralis CBS 781.70 TaxID=1392243 RepID=A0A6G1G9A4_9PEZI|nr:C6 zinc finger domain-containing protein [Eremomyces bilateralis CBS 781.70]KAF1814449.1 C6 zinc finger domain-containing protein [Eremomyces bilateralis CBS 781.70]
MSENGSERKSLAPPVKIACLSCRALKTRCDGGRPCSSCHIRERDCSYRPSRRGGARVRKNRHGLEQAQLSPPEISVSEESDTSQRQLPVENFIEPGAGLKRLPDFFQDSDFIFESAFAPNMSSIPGTALTPMPMVRTYQSDNAILEAYYVYIHPFFPILPPPIGTPSDLAISHRQDDIPEFEPSTPIALAISAVLALIPCPNDIDYQIQESVQFRRKYSQYLAQSSIESIENEGEIPESVAPSDALIEPRDELARQRFHPRVHPDLEDVIALCILSFYEYAQRGNIKKMQNRAGQAFVSAVALSLHDCTDQDEYSEVRSRVWWMTYICVTQATIVSNSEPTHNLFASSFTTKYPSLQTDSEAFKLFIQAQQTLLTCTRIATELVKTVKANADISHVCERMQGLEHYVESLATVADTWILQGSPTSPLDSTEEVVSRALRCMARIKLNSARIKIHRFCAFFDSPVFSGKYCDLNSTSWPTSSRSLTTNGFQSPDSPLELFTSSVSSAVDSLPFSRHQSTKICLKAAFNVAATFNDLPFPNPLGQMCAPPCYLAPTSMLAAPRLMPSLACCAMQCTYTLVMVHNRMQSTYSEKGTANPIVESLLVRLRMGLISISTIFENYATAFEALGGMRDQVRGVV